jgi:diguanylate cyclase (GGDEF)-like protein
VHGRAREQGPGTEGGSPRLPAAPARVPADGAEAHPAATVGAYMTRAVVTATPDMPLRDVCRLMIEHDISCVVVAEGGRPLGLISERTVVRRLARDRGLDVPANRAMSRPVRTCPPRTGLTHALDTMREMHIRRLAVVGGDGSLVGIITQSDLLEATNRQLADLTRAHGQLRQTAMRDELTGLYNRRAFNEAFRTELERARRYGGLLAMVLFDLDHFKLVNDRFGHAAGDDVLRRFARIVSGCCRDVDVPARPGGEEFAVLVPAAGTRAARVYAERVRRETEAMMFHHAGQQFRVTVSAGVCKWTRSVSSMRAMMAEADKAMYQAKRSGRNRVCVAR